MLYHRHVPSNTEKALTVWVDNTILPEQSDALHSEHTFASACVREHGVRSRRENIEMCSDIISSGRRILKTAWCL